VKRTIRNRIAGWLLRSAYPPDWMARLFEDFAGSGSSSGVHVGQETALTWSAFYSAVDSISRAVATLPLKVYRRLPDGSREEADGHAVARVVHHRPNRENTPYVFKATMQSFVLRWGNAYAEIQWRGDGRPAALWPIDSATMTVRREDDRRLVYIQNYGQGDRERRLEAADVIHIRGLGDGVVGKSPVRLFAEAIGVGLAAERVAAGLFGKGLRPSGTVEVPQRLDDIASDRLRKAFEARNAGPENFGRVLVLEQGVKFTAHTIPPDDAQFLETRVYGVRDVARIFHVPPHKLADLADATFSNVEEQNLEWVTDCLMPWMVNTEQEVNDKLFWPGEQERYYAEFDANGLLRGNMAARSTFYREMFGIGALSINDINRLENRPGIGPAGDVHFVPANMLPADQAMKPKPVPMPGEPKPPEPARPVGNSWGRIRRAPSRRSCATPGAGLPGARLGPSRAATRRRSGATVMPGGPPGSSCPCCGRPVRRWATATSAWPTLSPFAR